jgi:hypothetical protein
VALSGCSALGIGGTSQQIELWPLPPKPSDLKAEYRENKGLVCLPRQDFTDYMLYVEQLRNAAKEHGAVPPQE